MKFGLMAVIGLIAIGLSAACSAATPTTVVPFATSPPPVRQPATPTYGVAPKRRATRLPAVVASATVAGDRVGGPGASPAGGPVDEAAVDAPVGGDAIATTLPISPRSISSSDQASGDPAAEASLDLLPTVEAQLPLSSPPVEIVVTPAMAAPSVEATPPDVAAGIVDRSSGPGATPTPIATSGTPIPIATSTMVAGQVAEAVGQFVTSDGHGAKYYYSRGDNGWHRIHPLHRAWFATVDDLIRAYPNRVPHQSTSRTPTRSPTATVAH